MVNAQTARNFRRTTFANLGSPTGFNDVRKCDDCTVGAPTSGGGTGCYAYSTGSQWNCTLHEPGGGGGGNVSSVGLSLPSIFSVSGSPVTSAGTLTGSLATQSPNRFFIGPTVGAAAAPTFRAVVAADLGTGTADSTKFLRGDLTWQTALGSVTSVGLIAPVEFTVSGSPVTAAGSLTLTKANQSANLVFAGPTSGAAAQPGFRSLVEADITLSDVTTNNATTLRHGFMPKLTGNGSDCARGDGSFSTCPGAGTGGDFSTNTTTSAAQQVVVASGAGGKTGTFSTVSGVGILAAGVLTAKTNPSGAFVGDTDTQTLTNKTFTLPTIASFANANHNHTNSAGGGLLGLNAFTSSTGSGAAVGQTSPSLITPSLGVASATSINKVAFTAPATSATLTIANGKTLTANNSLTFTGTDATSMAFPATSGTVLTADSTATVSNKTYTLPILGGNSGLPATCSAGQQVRDTSVTPNTYYKCISTNTWGQELVAGTVGTVSPDAGGTGTPNPSGTITISGATSGSTTFGTAFGSTPRCTLTPTSDPGSGIRWWVTQSTTSVTANTSSSVTLTFNYHCLAP